MITYVQQSSSLMKGQTLQKKNSKKYKKAYFPTVFSKILYLKKY